MLLRCANRLQVKKMKVIGITGGAGSGKSALLAYMKDRYSCRILMADEAGHEVSRRGASAYPALTALLSSCGTGRPLLTRDGEIDRQEMAARIYADPALREQVNAIIHPAVKEYILKEIGRERDLAVSGSAEAARYFVLEAALLIECGYGAVVDEMWYIYCDPGIRAERLRRTRGYSGERVRGIMAAQLSDDAFRAGSDVVIDNSGDIRDARRRIDEEFARLEQEREGQMLRPARQHGV